ncbi:MULTISPECIES: nitroreductase family protein [unclassified Sporolactobacillus]|uniref:nitroreductase family protein n=1 Tax=unclassified Sporolactobacillus TaxID=2628533 RepID=UPI002368AC39|nr:nitroreductase [Sporolactobacillus sp. CQH2019]MDD9147567.1 nitroreductase [Sporolactobacillus sp. CQH2019]
METIEAIDTRRSVRKVTDQAVPKEEIVQILDAARRAPNHFNTQPWHFTVLTGEGRNKLGDVYGKANQQNLESKDKESLEAVYQKGLAKAKRSPVIIVVTAEPSDKPKVKMTEEIAATACAVENMLLAAHARGLGAMWRTGDAVYTDTMKQNFGISAKGLVIGCVYVGYPEEGNTLRAPARASVEEITAWVNE